MDFVGIIVAGGSGARAGAGGPKQWRSLGGKPVARWSLEAMIQAGAAHVIVVIPQGDDEAARRAFAGLRGWSCVTGGETRADSTARGLEAAAAFDPGKVLIHDAARPFLAPRHVERLLRALEIVEGAAPAVPAVDTLKRTSPDAGPVSTVDRSGIFHAQTPQAFRFDSLTRAYQAWPAGEVPTDDAQVLERAGGSFELVPGDPLLLKLTYPEDFDMAEMIAASFGQTRIGQGFDAHRFGPGESVWLCGVEIDHPSGLLGHSDADVGLHALTDAVLGAVGEGDIGDHFPPTDPRWRGAPSHVFLRHALDLVERKGGSIVNVDVTLICERPKVKPHRERMRGRIAEILRLPIDRVSVKATTTEGMGFTGREEGIAASAIASVTLPA
jgi:2-C-methyl-D-erythritol 4-phosphate cytidylyltransferase/2-C-methyl-D-erythritol 2,4-cyclodiphosphate synthase